MITDDYERLLMITDASKLMHGQLAITVTHI
jgi:hypothetical protein